jgi:alkaline phosphatase D
MTLKLPRRFSRRHFLSTGAGALGAMAMPYLSRGADRPLITHGVQSSDVGADMALWSTTLDPKPV